MGRNDNEPGRSRQTDHILTVVLEQIIGERVPPAADSHHDVLVLQHSDKHQLAIDTVSRFRNHERLYFAVLTYFPSETR